MKFKPMLAGQVTDIKALKFPVLVSKKLDGVRCLVQDGILVSRTLKPIPNKFVQAKFKGLPEGTDGELIVGDPREPDAYRKTVSVVMSDDKPLDFYTDTVRFFFFDQFSSGGWGFEDRLGNICDSIALLGIQDAVPVQHVIIRDEAELEQIEVHWLNEGYE